MARDGDKPALQQADDSEISRLRSELARLKTQNADQTELIQMRAEVGMLRAQVQRFEDTQKETEHQKEAMKKFLAWVALSAQEKTQLVADTKFAGDPNPKWVVELREHPRVILPAASKFDAIGKYQELCGITSTAHEFSAAPYVETTA